MNSELSNRPHTKLRARGNFLKQKKAELLYPKPRNKTLHSPHLDKENLTPNRSRSEVEGQIKSKSKSKSKNKSKSKSKENTKKNLQARVQFLERLVEDKDRLLKAKDKALEKKTRQLEYAEQRLNAFRVEFKQAKHSLAQAHNFAQTLAKHQSQIQSITRKDTSRLQATIDKLLDQKASLTTELHLQRQQFKGELNRLQQETGEWEKMIQRAKEREGYKKKAKQIMENGLKCLEGMVQQNELILCEFS